MASKQTAESVANVIQNKLGDKFKCWGTKLVYDGCGENDYGIFIQILGKGNLNKLQSTYQKSKVAKLIGISTMYLDTRNLPKHYIDKNESFVIGINSYDTNLISKQYSITKHLI
jgi:hypothetical protein